MTTAKRYERSGVGNESVGKCRRCGAPIWFDTDTNGRLVAYTLGTWEPHPCEDA